MNEAARRSLDERYEELGQMRRFKADLVWRAEMWATSLPRWITEAQTLDARKRFAEDVGQQIDAFFAHDDVEIREVIAAIVGITEPNKETKE